MSSHRNAIKRQKLATKTITKSATRTFESQLKADPFMKERTALFTSMTDRHIAEERAMRGLA